MKELAYVSGLRGTDGTGVFQAGVYRKNSKYSLSKMRSEVSYFLWYNENHKDGDSDILGSIVDNVFMGHVRAATKGAVTKENAHPFDVGRIVGAHNGTLRDKKYEDKDKTDSELMFRDIAARGLTTVLDELDEASAYAMTMFNKSTGELTFIKNDKRPLCYAYHKKRRVLYWASESKMMEFVASRQNYGAGMDISTIYRFTDDVEYKLHPQGVNAGKVPDWSIKYYRKPVLIKDKVPLITHVTPERENLTSHLLSHPQSNVLPLTQDLRRKLFNKEKKKLLERCVYCMKDMDLLEQYKGVEMDVGTYICETCDELNNKVMKEHLDKYSPKRN